MGTKTRWVLSAVVVVFAMFLLAWTGIFNSLVDSEMLLVAIAIIAIVLLRWWLGSLIGKAAARRNCGYLGWSLCSLLFGPLLVWIVYLCFVHWRPKI